MIYDTHCHLNQLSALQLAEQIELDCTYLSVGTSNKDWSSILELSKVFKNIYPALGLHPWLVDKHYSLQLDQLTELIKCHSINAIGEIGLDFSVNHIPSKSFQLEAFEQQLQIAHTNNLPISVHVYKAHSALLTLLKKYQVTGVIHGLGSSLEVAKSYLDLGYKIGVNGVSVKENAVRYHRMIDYFPIQSFVLETDAPNVVLPGHNSASLRDIHQVISQISNISGLSKHIVKQVTSSNAQSIFQF